MAAHVQDSRNDRFTDRHRASIAVAEILAGITIGLYADHMFHWVMGRSSDVLSGIAVLGVSLGFAAITAACKSPSPPPGLMRSPPRWMTWWRPDGTLGAACCTLRRSSPIAGHLSHGVRNHLRPPQWPSLRIIPRTTKSVMTSWPRASGVTGKQAHRRHPGRTRHHRTCRSGRTAPHQEIRHQARHQRDTWTGRCRSRSDNLCWSLILTFGCTGMIVWDGIDFANDYAEFSPDRRHLRELRLDASNLADELATIHAILETRYRR